MRRELASVTRSAGREPAVHEASKHEHGGQRAFWRPADPYPLRPGARRALQALIRALCPPAPAPGGDALFDRVETAARTCFRYMHPALAWGIQVTLLVLEWLPLLTLRWHRLHALAPEQVRALFGKLVESRLGAVRLSMVGLRAVVLGAYFDQDEVHRAIGYAPFPFMQERVLLRRSLLRRVAQSAQLATRADKPVAAE